MSKNSALLEVDKQKLTSIHFIICSLGFIFLLSGWAVYFASTWVIQTSVSINYSDWAFNVIEFDKPATLLRYMLTVVGLFGYYVGYYLFKKERLLLLDDLPYQNKNSFYLAALLLMNIALVLILKHCALPFLFLATGFWLLIFFAPFISLAFFKKANSVGENISRKKYLFFIAVIALLIPLCLTFIPYFQGEKLKISNDFMNAPEQTILNGHLVDNLNYINQNHIGGLSIYDPRLASSAQPPWRVAGFKNGAHLAKTYSKEELKFVRINGYEMHNQGIAGHYFHHHNAMIEPLNEYLSGKPFRSINFLYGTYSSIVLAHVIKYIGHGQLQFENYIAVLYSFYPIYYILLLFVAYFIFRDWRYVLLIGVVSYTSLYLVGFEKIHLAPGFNPLRHFFDLFVLLGLWQFLIAKAYRYSYLFLAFAFSILAILVNEQFGEMIFLALLAVIAIKLFKESGLNLKNLVILVAASIAGLLVVMLQKTAADPLALYSILGVSIPPTSGVIVLSLLVAINLLYIMLFVKTDRLDSKWFSLVLFLFFYGQAILIYYVWNTEPGHFLCMAPVFILLLASFAKFMTESFPTIKRYENSLILSFLVVTFIFPYPLSLLEYYRSAHGYEKIFHTHKVYQWQFPTANFQSTMDPAIFVNAVNLINKYAKERSIYMVSQYDLLLPLLAGKYNGMPFVQLDLSLVTDKEMNFVKMKIDHDKPKYIFVDSNIDRNRYCNVYALEAWSREIGRNSEFARMLTASNNSKCSGEIYDPQDMVTRLFSGEDSIYKLSAGRVTVLDNLGRFFDLIKADYTPVEAGNLITVYKRKAP